jgi:hypothetical protein
MTTDSAQPVPTRGSAESEVLRLRQQLAAREEVITQLNRRIMELPNTSYLDEPEADQDALAEALANGSALEAELQRLRQVVSGQEGEIIALRHQLGVYDRLGVSTAVGGAQKVRGLLRRVGGRT